MARLKIGKVWYRGDSRIVRLMKSLGGSLIREDGRIERVCEHEVGHTVGHINSIKLADDYIWIHGCDGCCSTYKRQEVME